MKRFPHTGGINELKSNANGLPIGLCERRAKKVQTPRTNMKAIKITDNAILIKNAFILLYKILVTLPNDFLQDFLVKTTRKIKCCFYTSIGIKFSFGYDTHYCYFCFNVYINNIINSILPTFKDWKDKTRYILDDRFIRSNYPFIFLFCTN